MTTATIPAQPSFLKKNLLLGITPAFLLVIVIMAISFGVHMVNIESIGDANSYYTAAVEAMLKSWSNFFFVAAEPGGSVTVDKPPLGLWIEAVFAFFLGVSGFSVSLPNILAGIFSIPLLYSMVKKYAGELAGLIAAFVMAFTPVFVATNRNNTMDGMLVFFLLMAAWAFIKATEDGKLRWLLLGGFIVGLGFNIKMMQAFLPLPAFYALYFFGSKEGWLRKILNLGIATVLLLAVSFSWAVVVDLTPADSRPYIGSSDNNTVMGLIFGHNGVSRLGNTGLGGNGGPQNGTPPTAPQTDQSTNQAAQPQQNLRQGPPQEALDACSTSSQGDACSFTTQNGNTVDGSCITPQNLDVLACAPQGMSQQNGQAPTGNAQTTNGNVNNQGPPQAALDACSTSTQGDACSFTLQNGNTINGSCVTPPNSSELACAPQGMNPQQNGQGPAGGPGGNGGTPFSQETGTPGVFRFFTNPLSKQMSWLLPFALISVVLALFAGKIRLPLESAVHKALVIWGGWLLTCVVFFSMVSGIFHSYYAIMLAPALGAMVGIGFAQLWSWGKDKKWIGAVLIGASLITLAFQLFASYQYGEQSWWMLLAVILFAVGTLSMVVVKRAAYLSLLASMLVIPIYWTMMTVSSNVDKNLPTAYTGGNQQQVGLASPRPQDDGGPNSNANSEMLVYLQANTQDVKYLAAVPSSQQGSTWVIQTGRPVLYMGGFGGQDDVVSAEDLAEMVANGELRYVLYGDNRGNKEDIANWLASSCSVVSEFSNQQNGQNQVQGPGGGGPGNQSNTLYMCK
ncbi:MAG: glycosyltransferase family 39 protein [Anaerolineales bacterium]|nr:glycosyltransferase family 39 protein [Anaerolineales bacterium]